MEKAVYLILIDLIRDTCTCKTLVITDNAFCLLQKGITSPKTSVTGLSDKGAECTCTLVTGNLLIT